MKCDRRGSHFRVLDFQHSSLVVQLLGPTGYEWERDGALSLQFLYHVSETGLRLSKSYSAALRLPPGADTRETWADASKLLPGHALKVTGRERRGVGAWREGGERWLSGSRTSLVIWPLAFTCSRSLTHPPSQRSSSDLEASRHSPRLRSRRRDARAQGDGGWGRVGWGRAHTESGNCHRNGDETLPSRPVSSASPLYEVRGLW